METEKKQPITVATTVKAPVERVWKAWTNPDEITRWNSASDDWHSPRAVNDLRQGGKFSVRMEAKDGNMGFDFGGEYDDVKENELIEYTMDDGRRVSVRFIPQGNETLIEETFDPENQNSLELQRNGWQAIMDNFKKHVEKA
jgi:uncharacterized protein YndB with AHSA1/START domain